MSTYDSALLRLLDEFSRSGVKVLHLRSGAFDLLLSNDPKVTGGVRAAAAPVAVAAAAPVAAPAAATRPIATPTFSFVDMMTRKGDSAVLRRVIRL